LEALQFKRYVPNLMGDHQTIEVFMTLKKEHQERAFFKSGDGSIEYTGRLAEFGVVISAGERDAKSLPKTLRPADARRPESNRIIATDTRADSPICAEHGRRRSFVWRL
jgi:hypothetical protein